MLTCALGLVWEISQGFQWTGQAGKQVLVVNLHSIPAVIFSTNQPVRHLFHPLWSSGLDFLGRCSLTIGMAPVKSKKEMKFEKEIKYSNSKSLSCCIWMKWHRGRQYYKYALILRSNFYSSVWWIKGNIFFKPHEYFEVIQRKIYSFDFSHGSCLSLWWTSHAKCWTLRRDFIYRGSDILCIPRCKMAWWNASSCM